MEFTRLLTGLMSTDNAVRAQAEQCFTQTRTTEPEKIVLNLGTVIATCPNPSLRALSAILLRRCVKLDSKIALSTDTVKNLQLALLRSFNDEPEAHICRKICHVIAPLAASCFMPNQIGWPELLPTIFASAKSEDTKKRVNAYYMTGKLCEFAEEMMQSHGEHLKEHFSRGLSATQPISVRIAAFVATSSFLLASSRKKTTLEYRPFEMFLPSMIEIISVALTAGEEEHARDSLVSLIDLVTHCSKSFSGIVDQLVVGMVSVAGSTSLDSSTRKLGMEILVTLSETEPAMARRCQPLITQIIPVTFGMLSEYDLDYFDANEYGNTDDDCDDPWNVSQDALRKIVGAIGKSLVSPLLRSVVECTSDASPTRRYAGVAALSAAINSGSRIFLKGIKRDLGFVSSMVVTLQKDVCELVQYETLTLIATLSVNFLPDFQLKYHDIILPAIVSAMSDTRCVKVRGQAASCITCFATPNECPEEAIEPHLNDLLGSLCLLLSNAVSLGNSAQAVQEEALKAVACVATIVETDFNQYYNSFIPGLKQILDPNGTCTGTKQASLRARALECLGLIVASVDAEIFQPDANAIMNMLQPSLARMNNGEVGVSDPQILALTNCCVNICRTIGSAFKCYLPHVMPSLFRAAAVEVSYTVTDVDDDVTQDNSEATNTGFSHATLNIRGFGNKRISLNTCAIEEKHSAVNCIREYAEILREDFYPFVEDASKILMQSCVSFQYFAGVRSAAVLALPQLVRSAIAGAVSAGQSSNIIQPLLEACINSLVNSVKTEMEKGDIEDISCAAEGLKTLMEVCYRSGAPTAKQENFEAPFLAPAILVPSIRRCQEISSIFVQCAAASVTRRIQVENEAKNDPYFDEEAKDALEEELEEEDELMTEIVDGIGYMIKIHKGAFLPVFEAAQVQSMFQKLLGTDMSDSLRINGICIFDDIIEHCGPTAHAAFANKFIPLVIDAIQSQHRGIQQCSLYGIGQCAAKAAQYFQPYCIQAIERITNLISEADKLTDITLKEESIDAVDNAIGALGRICFSHGQILGDVKISKLMELWVNKMPLMGDVIEARVVHSQLADLVSQKHKLIMLDSTNSFGMSENNCPNSLPQNSQIHPNITKAMVLIVAGVAEADEKAKQSLAVEFSRLPQTCQKYAVDASKLSNCKLRDFQRFMAKNQTLH